jgi:hypothetical protein
MYAKWVLRQLGIILDKYLIKRERNSNQQSVKAPWIHPIMCYNILTAAKARIATNK